MADIGQVDGRIGKLLGLGRPAPIEVTVTIGVRDTTGTSLKLVTKLQRDEIPTLTQFRAGRFV